MCQFFLISSMGMEPSSVRILARRAERMGCSHRESMVGDLATRPLMSWVSWGMMAIPEWGVALLPV